MLSKMRFVWSFGTPRTLSVCNRVLNKGLCNVNESADLPDWVKFRDTSFPVADSEDDFVLPTIAKWGNEKVRDLYSNVRFVSTEIIDIDADKISRVLQSKIGSPEEVVQALYGCSVDVSEDLVDKVLKRFSNDWVSSFGFFKWVQMQAGYKPSADSYDSMVDILGKRKQFDSMWGLVEEMAQLGGLISLKTMVNIMRRLAGAGKWADAIETFRKLERYGVSKDTYAMNALLDALAKERHAEHAHDAFLEFKNEVPPDSHTFNIVMNGWCKFRKLDKALWVMEEMKKHGFEPCATSYTILIEAYCRDKDFRKVYAILDEMETKGCPPNAVTYTIVMHSLGKAKETHEALEIYERMKRNGCNPDTFFYNALIYVFSKSGRLHDAQKIYEEMPKSGCEPNAITYKTMISAACEYSQEENALKLLLDMEERKCKPDVETYAPLLKMCCRKKRMKLLLYLLNDMFKKDISLDVGTYSLLVKGLSKSGKLEHACFFFEEMVLKGLAPWSNIYNMLVEELKRNNMEDAVERIQKLMVKAETMGQSGSTSGVNVNLEKELVKDL